MSGAATPAEMRAEASMRAARRHSDKPDDNRSPFQRDRDRILYTSAFRRLAGVTQVVSALEGHVYHNRLTHSLKVAQVSRRVAEKLIDRASLQVEGSTGLIQPHLSADVAEAAALAHDIGHPPFGHVAEVELQACMKEFDDEGSFEGNAQSFHVVTKTAMMDREFSGLNLTRATLDAVLKYPWMRDRQDKKASEKWGYFPSDEDDFRFARCLQGPPPPSIPGRADSGGQSLEASIMDWADDITYAVHDAEDHYRAGLVPLHRLLPDSPEFGDFVTWVERRWAARRDGTTTSAQIATAAEVIPVLFGSADAYEGTNEQRTTLRAFSSALIARYIGATDIRPPRDGEQDWQLTIEPWARLEVNVLKELAWRYVIERPALAAQQHGQRQVIAYVFDVFMTAAEAKGTEQSVLPIRTRQMVQRMRDLGQDTPASRGRAVCDAICAMTEDEIVRLHSRLTGLAMGSVLDAIV